ncbi:hypothetical protein [Aeromonas hydrophila]|uniref:hypothetical protein n=1 Tax=Aeromonas hydrophila TaxID=644 RepID=UPI003D23FD81
MQTITLVLTNKEITLSTHDVEGSQLYKAQDLLKGYGLDVNEANKKMYNFTVSMKNKNPDFQGVSFKGKNGGTYLTKRQILKLAGYVSYEFEDAVYEAFEMLMDGKGNDAIEKALSVAVIHPVMMQPRPLGTLKKLFKESGLEIDVFVKQVLVSTMNNQEATIDERLKMAKALIGLTELPYTGKDFAGHALRFLAAQNEIHKYRATKMGQAGNMKKTLAIKANRKLSRKAEDLEVLIEETELELEDMRNRAKKIGTIAIEDRKQKNELEGKIIELEEKLVSMKEELEVIPF